MPLQFPVADTKTVVAASAIVLLNEVVPPFGAFFSKQRSDDVEAVETGVFGKLDLVERSQAGCEVNRANQFARQAGLDASAPTCDERRARAAFQDAVFPTAERTSGLEGAVLFLGGVLVSVDQHWPVVGAEDDECLLLQVQSVERLHQFADAPIQLYD